MIVNGYKIEWRANLRGADLAGANLRGADLAEADLREANLYGANLREANLREANLRGANLRGADLAEADFYKADLRGANLNGADLRHSDLQYTCVYTFSFGRHVAYVHESSWRVGCAHGTLNEFDEDRLTECAIEAGYTEEQIIMYRDAFRYLIKKVRSK